MEQMREEDKLPTLSYWKGVPLAEVPREELEEEFVNAWVRIQELERWISELSVGHIRDIARLARR
jgi:hypothetical protein